jgi:hypothetical protein
MPRPLVQEPGLDQPQPEFREAREADLPSIVSLLANDPLGALREDPDASFWPAYRAGFEATHDGLKLHLDRGPA